MDLAFAGLARHAELIAAGELSSRELVELFLSRITRLDPALNAFRVVLAEQALAEADAADARRAAGDRSPLLGVPLAIKDEMHVAGQTTMFGCDWDPPVQAADSEVVARLRAAGAVILGKTHVPELMATGFTESPSYGATRNPWDRTRTSGGSSGGSATAVAAGLASAALGSDGAGSIRIPAACCGLVGFKCAPGRVPTAPDVDPFGGMTVFGPLTRSIVDAARFMDAVRDGGPSFAEALQAPRPLRIAVATAAPPGAAVKPDAEQLAGVETTAELLRGLGHAVVERELDWGIAPGNRVLARFVRAIADQAAATGQFATLSRRARGLVRIGRAVPPQVARAAARASAADAARLDTIFQETDVVLTPMFTRRPLRVREYEGRSAARTLAGQVKWAPYAGPFNHTGHPALAVPAGFAADGFPLGVQLVAPRGGDGEARLFALGAQLEAARDWRSAVPAL